MLTKGTQTTWGMCRWIKKAHFSSGMYSCSTRGTVIAATECWWPYWKLPECSTQKNPDNSSEALAHFPYIPSLWCMSKVVMMSLNDVRIICSPFLVGKALHMHRRAALICLCTHWDPCWLFSTAIHEPCCHFCIPNSEPVTLSPRYFGAPLYQSLKLIKNAICTAM